MRLSDIKDAGAFVRKQFKACERESSRYNGMSMTKALAAADSSGLTFMCEAFELDMRPQCDTTLGGGNCDICRDDPKRFRPREKAVKAIKAALRKYKAKKR